MERDNQEIPAYNVCVPPEKVKRLKEQVTFVLGDSAEDLAYECETTTCFSIACLYPVMMIKVEGTLNGNGHFWLEIQGEIIDLSTEQFSIPFEYPLTEESKKNYQEEKRIQVTDAIYQDSLNIALISGFQIHNGVEIEKNEH